MLRSHWQSLINTVKMYVGIYRWYLKHYIKSVIQTTKVKNSGLFMEAGCGSRSSKCLPLVQVIHHTSEGPRKDRHRCMFVCVCVFMRSWRKQQAEGAQKNTAHRQEAREASAVHWFSSERRLGVLLKRLFHCLRTHTTQTFRWSVCVITQLRTGRLKREVGENPA